MAKPLRGGYSAHKSCYASEKYHHCLFLSVMQVMKMRLRNTRPATKDTLYYIEKVYIHSLIYTQIKYQPLL